jgi:hypothetical protein
MVVRILFINTPCMVAKKATSNASLFPSAQC